MTINIPINVTNNGAEKSVGDFQAIAAAIKETAAQADGVTALAQSLGKTYKEAKQLSQEMGLSADQAAKAVSQLKQLKSVGADSATQFQVLSGKLGVTEKQFQALSKQVESTGGKATGLGAKFQQGFAGVGNSVTGTIFLFNQLVQSLGLIAAAAQQAYGLLIGQNVQLQNQLLGTQATLAATNKVLVDGVQIKDPTKAIQALEGPVKDAVARIRAASLDLVGVTSAQIIPLFQIISGQSSQIGANLNQSADLAVSFAAAMGTLKIPLDQANQEINSILTGQITMDSRLAKSLGLNNEMVNQWKNQGTLVENLNKKLEAFRAGNALQAKTLDGVTSNILEILQEVGRVAGEPLLQPLVAQLDKFYQFLQTNKQAIIEFASSASDRFLAFAKAVGESVVQIGQALAPAIKGLGPIAKDTIELVLEGFQALAAATAVVAKALGPAVEDAVKVAAFLNKALKDAQTIVALTTGGFDESTEAVAAAGRATAQLSEQSITLQGKLKAAIEAKNQAQKDGRKLTDDEIKTNKSLEQQKQGLIGALQDQLKALNEQVPIGAANTRNLQNQRKELEARIKALQSDSLALQDNKKNIQLVADATVVAQQKLAGIKQQSKAGLLDEDQAIKDLNAIRNNAEVSKEVRKEAADELLNIRKKQNDAELAQLDAQRSQIEARVKAGTLSEAASEQELTNIKKEEIQKRLQLNREQQGNATGSDRKKLAAEEKKLQAELLTAEADAANARRKRLIEDYDERRSVLEGQFAQGKISQQQYNKDLLSINLKQNDEELRQLQDQLKKLGANDKEGREAINAKIGETYKKRADIIRAAYERELKTIEDANTKAIETSRLAETNKEIEVQKARNSGVTTAIEAENQKGVATIARIDAEIKAEQEKYAKLQSLKPANPEDEQKRQKDLLASQNKIADLTLNRLKEQQATEERIRAAAIQAIDDDNNKQVGKVKLAETLKLQEIQRSANQGVITQKAADAEISKSKIGTIAAEIAAERRKYDQLSRLKTTNAESAKKKDQDLLASQSRIAELELQQLQEVGAAQEKVRQQQIEALKQQQQIEQATTRIAIVGIEQKISGLNRQKAAQEAIGRSLERQQKLAEAANNLDKVRAASVTNYYDAQIAGASKALELVKQYNAESDPEKKLQQEQLLQALGLSAVANQRGELDLLKQKQALEDAQAAAKERQRQAEQVFARNQLELNLKKMEMEARLQLIAAKRAEFEAKITEQKAKQALSDANAELAQAKLIKDPGERQAAVASAEAGIAEAQQGVAAARDQRQLAKEQRTDAEQNIKDVQEIGDKQRETLAIQQQNENAIAGQTEGMRQLNQVLELSQQGAEGFAAALQKAANASQVIQGALSGAQIPQARFAGGDVAPGQPYTVAEAGPEIIRYPDGSFDYVPAPSLIMPDRRGHVLTARETAAFLGQIGRPQIPSAIAGGGVGNSPDTNLKGEFAKLTDAIYTLAHTPRNLTMQSDNPLSDAADYTRELMRQKTRLRGW